MHNKTKYYFSGLKKSLLIVFLGLIFSLQAQNFIIHKVQKGETLRDIAKQYQLAPSDIIRYNADVRPEGKLEPGQPILIPKEETLSIVKDTIKLTGKIIDYKYHTVGDNETLFSLSKQYHSNIESIVRINNVEGFNIKLGQILIIPIFEAENAEKTIDESKYTYYIVKPKQGKWRVAYDHGITIDELERLNPEIKNETLKVGQKLVVPKFVTSKDPVRDEIHYIYYDVQPKETMYSLSKRFNISIDEMIALNPELKEGLKFGQTIKFPRNSSEPQTTERLSDFDTKIDALKHQDSLHSVVPDTIVNQLPEKINLLDSLRLDKTYKLAILLPLKLKEVDTLSNDESCNKLTNSKIIDYYSGIKLAIDSLGKLGMKIEYDVFDTQASPYVTGKILEITDLSDYDFVIGPVKKDNIEKVTHILEFDNTPVAVHSYKGDQHFRNIVVTGSRTSDLEKHMLQYLKEKSEAKLINFIYDPTEKQKADTLAVQLGLPVTKIEGKETKKGYSISADDISEKMDKNKENYVVLLSKDDSFIFSVLSTLNSLRDTHKITLFTFDDKRLYEDDTNDRMNVFLANLNYHFPAKMTRLIDKKLAKIFKEKYNTIPSFTAINGFDTTFDLLVRAANADNLFEGLQKIGRTHQTSKVYLYKHSPETGFHNQGSVILRVNRLLELERVE
jgi:LysM repeat protein